MDEKIFEVIEEVMQLKISNFIKENRDMDKKLLAEKIEEMLKGKEEMYNMDEAQIKEILKNMKWGIKNGW